MTIRLYRIVCSCLVSQAVVLLILLRQDQTLAHDIPDSDASDIQQNSDVQQSELPNPEFSPHGPFQGPITIPHIARLKNLPMRMFLEPHLISPGTVEKVDSSFMELFDKTLREFDDDELLETAALSVARIAHEKLNDDLSRSTDILLKHLESHSSLRVRFACARALVNTDVSQSAAAVLALDKLAGDSQRLWIDPALSRWKFTAAGDVWKQRLANDSETAVAVSLACEGLAALGDGIIAMVSDTLLADREDWQGIEQCLLLGQLRMAQFSDRCVPLLEHPRNEVLVTSAWLLHLFPDPAVEDAVKNRLIRNEGSLRNRDGASARNDLDKQSSYLIQYAGLRRLKGIQPHLEPAIRKAPRVHTFKRAAAIWTIGLLNENNPAPDLAGSLAGRVADRIDPGAEQLEVRRISAIALGMMRAKSAASGLLEAYELDPSGSVIPDSARWALGMMGEALPDPVKPYAPVIGGWKLSPIVDR